MAQSNLAIAKSTLCQVEDKGRLLPLGMYRNTLVAPPVGHVDQPLTLIQRAIMHFTQFERLRDEVEGARAEAVLQDVVELYAAESYESRVAAFMLQVLGERRTDAVQQSSMELDPTTGSTAEDTHILTVDSWPRFDRPSDLADLEKAIRIFQELVKSTRSTAL